MKSIPQIKGWISAHKKASVVIVLILILGGYGVIHSLNGGNEEVRYVLATAGRGTIITSVSGTGQVSASNQVDLASKVSGTLIYLNAKVGQSVGTNTLIGQIDAGNALYELETARLSYEQLVTIDDDDLSDAEDTLDKAQISLEDAYVDARSTLASSATDMADVMADLKRLFSGYLSTIGKYNLSRTAEEYVERAHDAYYDADDTLDEFLKMYRTVSNETDNDTIESMLSDANQTATAVAQATKYAKDAVVYLRDREDDDQVAADEAYATVSGLVTTVNATVSDTLSSKNSLIENKRTQENAETDLNELKDGPDTLDLRSEELSLRQKEEAYADYFVRASFSGIIAAVPVQKGDTVSSGTTIVTLITQQKIAEISLNEVDAAKVKTGQKATLTFDAIEDLTITGEVLEVDLVGTVSQGVVSYNIKIGFDTDDDRVKPGMTVSANIITDMRQDVLMVPTSAVKTQGNITYVEIVDQNDYQSSNDQTAGVLLAAPPEAVQVTVGLSNDELTEILSGLEEGQRYIAQTITQGTTQTSTQAPSLFGTGGRTTGGNFPR